MAKKTAAKVTVGELVEDTAVELSADTVAPAAGMLARIGEFLAGATAIQTRAEKALEFAKAFPAIRSSVADENAKKALARVDNVRKDAEGYWGDWKRAMKAAHTSFVAGEKKALEPAAEARRILTERCNTWAESERRRVERENDARRVAAEALAQAQRIEQLAELERQALAAEASSPELQPREQTFADGIVRGLTPLQAAQVAGYVDPQEAATRLFVSPKVVAYIAAVQAAAAAREAAAQTAAAPVDVSFKQVAERVSDAKTQVNHWSGRVLDAAALLKMVKLGGPFAPPDDLFIVDEVRLNAYARSLDGEKPESWVGVEFVNKPTWR